jgi:exonuclease 1
MFLTTCILSGCDYLSQIAGIGLKTAQKSIGRVTTFRGFLGEISNKSLIPPDYEASFMRAFLTFRFQRVYCPLRRSCVELNDMALLQQPLEGLLQEERQERPWSE